MKRVTVDFADEAYMNLDEIAKDLSTTKAEALRKALGLLKFALEEKKRGSKLIFENEKENLRREIIQL